MRRDDQRGSRRLSNILINSSSVARRLRIGSASVAPPACFSCQIMPLIRQKEYYSHGLLGDAAAFEGVWAAFFTGRLGIRDGKQG